MQIISTLLLTLPITLPLALAKPTPPGCGTIQDEAHMGQTLVGDQKCNGIGSKQARWLSVGECLCGVFSGDLCFGGDPKTWAGIIGGPIENVESKKGVHWYQCTGDQAVADVSKV